MKQFIWKHKVLWISIILSALTIMLMSCGTSGYGCKGRESWKHMERRINRPY